jgi:hypothetical protein
LLDDCLFLKGDPMLKLTDIIEAYHNATPKEQEDFIKMQIKHPFFEEKINDAIDKFLITSGMDRLIARVSCLETGLFKTDLEGELVRDGNDIPVLSHDHTTPTEKPIETESGATPTIETTLDMKACAVVEYLKEEMKPNDFGEFVIDRKELSTFMQGIIEDGLRVQKVSRQLKADLFERAVKLFPDIVYIKRSPSGNRTKLLALKTSQKRTFTHTMTRITPLGIIA